MIFFVMLLPLVCPFLQETRRGICFVKWLFCNFYELTASKDFLCTEFFCKDFGRDGMSRPPWNPDDRASRRGCSHQTEKSTRWTDAGVDQNFQNDLGAHSSIWISLEIRMDQWPLCLVFREIHMEQWRSKFVKSFPLPWESFEVF